MLTLDASAGAHRRARPPSLRQLLIALLLVPLLGLMISTFIEVRSELQSVRAADRAIAHVDAAATYVRVRSTFSAEIYPAEIATVHSFPYLVKGLNLTLAQEKGQVPYVQAVPGLRRATDAAVAAMSGNPVTARNQSLVRSTIAHARDELDNPDTFLTAADTMGTIQGWFGDAADAALDNANASGLRGSVAVALGHVALVADATNAAMQELNLFGRAQFYTDSVQATAARITFAKGWAAFEGSSNNVVNRTDATTAAQWNAVGALPAVRAFDSAMEAGVLTSTDALTSTQDLALTSGDSTRSQAYLDVLAKTLAKAVAGAHDQRTEAMHNLLGGSLITILMTLLSLIIAVLVTRAVTRPLDRLAEAATRVSEGDLVDVSVDGPREIRTVAHALEGSVASLRKIEAQAAAVAAGDLSSPVVNQALPGPLGSVVHASVTRIITAIRDRETAQQELAHRASHDPLTELPNRAQALSLIEHALHRAQRSGTKTALMFVDLDDFKLVNDNFGHAIGDEVLQVAAIRMGAAVRDGDSVARLGGDEFLILLENIDDEADVIRLATRVVGELTAPMAVTDRSVTIGSSIGVAFCRDGYVDADRLLSEADAAVYRAKNAGRGRVEVFDDALRADLIARSEMDRAIAAALAEGQFVLHYQPVIDLRSGKTIGVEALIRWDRPGHGLIAPMDFIPLAEQSTLINEVGRWVLSESTRQLAAWDASADGPHGLTMAINISGRHLISNRLVSDVTDALVASGVPARRLVVELTETVLVDDPLATENLYALRALGVQISIDDFGTGYTSIGQLPRLPVDTLKIDRSFIASADPAHKAIVRLVVGAAHAFGLSVVAEGIEAEHQAEELRATNVEQGQGYLFGRPQTASEITRRSADVPAA